MTDTDTREMHEFLNRLRALWNIDREQVPGLTFAQWERFRDAPLRALIRADDATAAVIWRAMQDRLGGSVGVASPNIAAIRQEARVTALDAAVTAMWEGVREHTKADASVRLEDICASCERRINAIIDWSV